MMSPDCASQWSQHAETYARLFAPLTGYIARSMFTAVRGELKPGAQVLDIACGTGALALPAAEHAIATAGRVVATDFAPAMVEYTERAAQAAGLGSVITCQVEDGEALSFADASFDAVFSSFGIFLFADRLAGWREAARVLRPGGVFAATCWQGPEHNPMLRAQLAPMVSSLPKHLLPPSGGRSWMDIAAAGAFLAEVTSAAPLRDARCHPFTASIVLPNSGVTFDAMLDNPVMGGILRACSHDELATVRAAVTNSLDEIAGGAGKPIVLESAANILVARRT
jgi:SAM-dependent methyltransferase